MTELTLLTRPGCHLCDDARAAVARAATGLAVAVTERDITASPEDFERWGEWIPVVLVDGREHSVFRVDEPRLRATLCGASQPG